MLHVPGWILHVRRQTLSPHAFTPYRTIPRKRRSDGRLRPTPLHAAHCPRDCSTRRRIYVCCACLLARVLELKTQLR